MHECTNITIAYFMCKILSVFGSLMSAEQLMQKSVTAL